MTIIENIKILINNIINNLLRFKLDEGEVESLIKCFSPFSCPCMLLQKECNECEYKTIEEEREYRHHSGCVDAVEYSTYMGLLNHKEKEYIITDIYRKILYEFFPDLVEKLKKG